MIAWLDHDTPFPDVSHALTEADGAAGLLAAGADLSAQRLLQAYQHGIFPWYSRGQPIMWWSPDPRMVLFVERFVISNSLKKSLRKVHNSMASGGPWQLRFDTAFVAVMHACAQPRDADQGTWITNDMIEGYCALHDMGYAHSSELWHNDALVGGVYGICIGRMFYGESMFARVTDASKIALAYLVHFLKAQGVVMIDCQQKTPHLASLGAECIPRAAFLQHLNSAINQPPIATWQPLAIQ